MTKIIAVLICLAANDLEVETRFEQAQPPPGPAGMTRSPGQDRAILLIHGLTPHFFSNSRVRKAVLHSWQQADSVLVKALAKEGDVFCFAYGQNVPLETIPGAPELASSIRKLRFLGYKEVVLVGHSAGGVVARMFVEDHADAGITKVIQICSPNIGSSFAKIELAVRKDQEPFLHSLTKTQRNKTLEERAGKQIPAGVEFLCIVGASGPLGDGVVAPSSQWPEDLQKQGIPALRIATSHFTVMRSAKTAEKLAEVIRDPHPRWSAEQVQSSRKKILVGID